MDLQKQLHALFLKNPTNCFDGFIEMCQKWYEEPAHTLTEMRTRDNKKIRGDIFEEFCVLYLKNLKGYTNVWRLEDVPETVLTKLSLKRRDMGIDIITEKDNHYAAVQCKYKTPTGKTSYITWKALSTFYALCLRTGPWSSYIVITNCNYARHEGKKTAKDISYCLKTFQNMSQEQWTTLCEIKGNQLVSPEIPKEAEAEAEANADTHPENTIVPAVKKPNPWASLDRPLTQEELRAARLAYYDQKGNF
jgi:hypothetical protein